MTSEIHTWCENRNHTRGLQGQRHGEALRDREVADRAPSTASQPLGIPVLDLHRQGLGMGLELKITLQLNGEVLYEGMEIRTFFFSNASRFPYRPMFGMQQRAPLSHVGPRER